MDRTPESSPQPMADAIGPAPAEPHAGIRAAAQFVAAFSNVLAIGGSGSAPLAQALPEGCDHRAQPLEASADNLRRVMFGNGGRADIVVLCEPLDRLEAPADVLRTLRALGCPVVFTAAGTGGGGEEAGPAALAREAGFWLQHEAEADDGLRAFKAMPGVAPRPPARSPRVLVLSYYNDPNFGDRLGFHIVNGLTPAGAVVTHASVKPWTVPEEDFDLLILGTGHSLNATTVGRPELHRLVERMPHAVGIFGTQYRHQYRELIQPDLMARLVGNLTTWWARYEEDVVAFGRGRNNVRHLGDLLISAFPLATPTDHRTLVVNADIVGKNLPLDRVIQQIQTHRRVSTARIHPMLCALTSAEEVRFQEQQEDPSGRSSGKFRSQLYDVFGRTYEEDRWFGVDRDAVARYKRRVEANMVDLRAQISDLLA